MRSYNLAVAGEAQITRAATLSGCTPQGTTWLKNALDPFPDIRRDIVGYPDTVKTPSVVQYFREEIQVSKPVGISGLWDCLIWHPGVENGNSLSLTDDDQLVAFGRNTQTGGGITSMVEVRAAASGTPLTIPTIVQHSNPAVSFEMPHRLISLGVETFNTTAEINIQGAALVFKQPAIKEEFVASLVDDVAGSVHLTPMKATMYYDAPASVTQAIILEGSRQWKAEQGSYCSGTLAEPTNPPKTSLAPELMVVVDDNNDVYASRLVNLGQLNLPEVNCKRSGFDQFGTLFTGLSEETTFQTVIHYVIERFPTANDGDLITLAKPSMPYDPAAIELYTKIVSKLEAGVPVADNDAGMFISAIGSIAAKTLPYIIKGVKTGYTNRDDGKTIAQKTLDVLKSMSPMGWVEDLPKIGSKYGPPRGGKNDMNRNPNNYGRIQAAPQHPVKNPLALTVGKANYATKLNQRIAEAQSIAQKQVNATHNKNKAATQKIPKNEQPTRQGRYLSNNTDLNRKERRR